LFFPQRYDLQHKHPTKAGLLVDMASVVQFEGISQLAVLARCLDVRAKNRISRQISSIPFVNDLGIMAVVRSRDLAIKIYKVRDV
jgi:hypothetical protein